MGTSGRTISQQAFDELLAENISDLGMDPDEALEDAVEALTLQGVDLSGIVKCVPGVNSVEDNPVMQSLDGLKKASARLQCSEVESSDLDEIVRLLDEIYGFCSSGGENALIAMRNGGVELLVSICSACRDESERVLVSGLRALRSILRDFESRQIFWRGDGHKIVMDILKKSSGVPSLLDCGFSVVVSAATGNEIIKEAFVELKIDELFLEILRGQPKDAVPNLYDAICVILTPDDNRVAASQVYGYARRFAKIGIADALVDVFHQGISSSSLVSACSALKAISVNDEICRSISSKGGIDVILQCIDDSSEYNNNDVAKTCCSLLSKLAGSDSNKNAIIQKGGLDKLIKLSSRFFDDPSVSQEVMSIISVLSLRSPENASRAIEVCGDLAIQEMQKFPVAYKMQRQSCYMIRNLVCTIQDFRG